MELSQQENNRVFERLPGRDPRRPPDHLK